MEVVVTSLARVLQKNEDVRLSTPIKTIGEISTEYDISLNHFVCCAPH